MTEEQIRQQAIEGTMNVYDAAWAILEIRRNGNVRSAHPADQEAVKRIVESITRERAGT